jgi:hypothetical protein
VLRRREWDYGHPGPQLSNEIEDLGAMYQNPGIHQQLIHATDHELSISSQVDKSDTHIVNENEAGSLAMTSRILHLQPGYK